MQKVSFAKLYSCYVLQWYSLDGATVHHMLWTPRPLVKSGQESC